MPTRDMSLIRCPSWISLIGDQMPIVKRTNDLECSTATCRVLIPAGRLHFGPDDLDPGHPIRCVLCQVRAIVNAGDQLKPKPEPAPKPKPGRLF